MAWTYLFVAGLVEIAMVLLLRAAQGWTRFWPGAFGLVAGAISVFLLTHALKTLPVGTAYAVWTGIGSVGVTVIGIAAFNEGAAPARLLCIALVVAGMVGLRLLEGA
jgi:quaternary ammonium compound-resistance protein SugE